MDELLAGVDAIRAQLAELMSDDKTGLSARSAYEVLYGGMPGQSSSGLLISHVGRCGDCCASPILAGSYADQANELGGTDAEVRMTPSTSAEFHSLRKKVPQFRKHYCHSFLKMPHASVN